MLAQPVAWLSLEAGAQEPAKTGVKVLETVLVTATRRSESAQDVGLSMTVLDEDALNAKGVELFFDFATAVPNLSFGVTGDGALAARSVAIRGIQGAGTTGFYIDDTPVLETIDPRILDIERVEVLRGPQGTLWGARSMGGNVRLITKQPSTEGFEGMFHAGSSVTDEGGLNYTADGAVNIPMIDDTLSARISAFYNYEEGFFDKGLGPRTAPPTEVRKNIDDLTAQGGQIALRWEPTDELTITPRIMYQKVEMDGFRFADREPGNFLQRQILGLPEGGEDEWYLGSLTVDYATEYGALTSSTSYFERDVFEFEDATDAQAAFFGVLLPSPISRARGLERFVQELRFSSELDGPLQFVVGAFYSDSTIPRLYTWTTEGAADIFGTDTAVIFDDERTAKEAAVFGEVSYALTEALTATLGLRYFRNETTFTQFTDGYFYGGVSSTINPPDAEDNGINPKLLLEYQWTDNVMTYVSAAEGFRIGGNNIGLPPSCDAELEALGTSNEGAKSYDSDSLWSYEAGIKSTLADQRVTLNAAVFHAVWSDIQSTVLLDCGFGFTGNAGEAESTGFEVEMNAQVTNNLKLGVNLGYNKAEITKAGGATGQSKGDPIYQVPEWTFSSNIEYRDSAFADYEWVARADFSYVDESFSVNNAGAGSARLRPDYQLLDARVGLQNDLYTFTLYAKNLTNEEINLSDNRSIGVEVNDLQRIVTNRPRTIGFEVRANF
ncbi:MAG: TonB-dependent receptor [Haliea sp.]